MPAGNTYPAGHLVPSPFEGLAYIPIVETSFPTLHRFMTVPNLTFIELREVSMDNFRRVWHARREHLPFRTPGSVPLFGTCLYSNSWDQIPRTCHVFTRLFNLNNPWYFLDLPFNVVLVVQSTTPRRCFVWQRHYAVTPLILSYTTPKKTDLSFPRYLGTVLSTV